MTRIVTRFAPSPTGRLHLGHAYSAMRAHGFAREQGGQFLLRIEDIDRGRSREEHVVGIIEDLLWLGLDWDGEIVFQSERAALYALALEELKRDGLAYRCFCTRAEIAASASAPHGDLPAIYPGTCRHLADAEAREGAPHCWRLDMAAAMAKAGPLVWHDADGSEHEARPARHGDVVLARKDAPASYHLAVTVDDAAQGVTHVVRGRDLLASTDVHRLLQALLGLPVPAYSHHALVADAQGKRLAKRDGAVAIAALRASGVEPGALLAELRAERLPEGYSFISSPRRPG